MTHELSQRMSLQGDEALQACKRMEQPMVQAGMVVEPVKEELRLHGIGTDEFMSGDGGAVPS